MAGNQLADVQLEEQVELDKGIYGIINDKVQAKEWLTLNEAALLPNVSPLTLRRRTLAV